ncbi:MAG: response regulator, partial [bacterium]|nr:response regulator [bacterium]
MGKILIVDDDFVFCTQLSLYVRKAGMECEIAGTLGQGLEIASKNRYDLVFLDVVLPDASGLDGIGKFRFLPSSPEVIIITGGGDTHGAEM